MNKTTLTLEQEKQFELFMENRTIQEAVDDWYLYKNNFKELSELAPYEFVSAAIVGYEVEKMPEEAIKEMYEKHQIRWVDYGDQQSSGIAQGILFTINRLDIKIEGINE